ncbi:fasciclin-3-like [Ochlerotatus camptorhynchus]|uniref:fasciclin-3-like n=1 Tax=Ochlerotatus camptorhynchus TaxID=644619 RepID=UPI0031E2AAAF
MIKFCAAIVLIAFVSVGSAIEVITAPKSVIATEGQRQLNLLCETPGSQPIDFCIVKVPGAPAPFASSERLPAPVAGIRFFGRGWSKGSCGISLDTVKAEHEGTFECTLSIAGKSYTGTIGIVVQGEAVAPEPPVIEVSSNVDDSDGEFDYGKPLTARCIARDGRPGAKLSWYMDGKPISNELGAAFAETANRRTTVQQFYRKPVAVEDNRKRLVCRAEHERYPNGFIEAALEIKLRKTTKNANQIQAVGLKEAEVKPSPPQLLVSSDILTSDGAFKVGSDMVFECVARDGRPAASFLWFLDDQLIYEGLSAPFQLKNSRGTITTQQVLQRVAKASDNGKTLICKARHPSGTSETQLKLKTYS